MIACWYGHHKLAKNLLEKDVKLDMRNRNGLTALMISCQQGHTAVMELHINLMIS